MTGEASSVNSDASRESSGYLIGKADPAEVAESLGASGAKLIGGQVIGSLRFEGRDREREFLGEAGASFCFPLMEKRLMNTGAANALWRSRLGPPHALRSLKRGSPPCRKRRNILKHRWLLCV